MLSRQISEKLAKQDIEQAIKATDAGKRIIEKETIEVGKVKLSVYEAYFKACGYLGFNFFLLLNLISAGFMICSSFWLSRWSDSNVTKTSDKLYQFGGFMLLGILQCKI